jgi:hypothetical protein
MRNFRNKESIEPNNYQQPPPNPKPIPEPIPEPKPTPVPDSSSEPEPKYIRGNRPISTS